MEIRGNGEDKVISILPYQIARKDDNFFGLGYDGAILDVKELILSRLLNSTHLREYEALFDVFAELGALKLKNGSCYHTYSSKKNK